MKLVKKEFVLHLSSTILFFAIITLYKRWFDSPWYLMFWAGGVLGALLPDLDHFVYTLLLYPQEAISRQVQSLLAQRKALSAYELHLSTRYERTKYLFHTAFFQLFFIIFAFLVISSSGSLFGRGLVLAFMLHLLVDQAQDLRTQGTLKHWFQDFPLILTRTHISFYWVTNFGVLTLFGLFF